MINIANITRTNILHPKFFQWERKTLLQNNEIVALDMEGSNYNDVSTNTSRHGTVKFLVSYLTLLVTLVTYNALMCIVCFQLKGFCSLDHSKVLPHMLHTENSTQIDIILDQLQTNKSFSNSRFAIELLVVGIGNPDIPMFINPKKSLDDEHTPGIFEVISRSYLIFDIS